MTSLTQSTCTHAAPRLSQKAQEQPLSEKGILPHSKVGEGAHGQDSLNVGEEASGLNTIKRDFKNPSYKAWRRLKQKTASKTGTKLLETNRNLCQKITCLEIRKQWHHMVLLLKKGKGEICIKTNTCKELSLAPETSAIPMKSWWKGTYCHRVLSQMSQSSGFEEHLERNLGQKKIVPPGFIRILLKERLDCYCCQANPKPCLTIAKGSFQSLRRNLFY